METNFFNQIAQLDFTGVLQLYISKGAENNLIVSTMLNNEQCGDNAKNLISPFTFNATPQEFDEKFFERITAPVEKVSGLMVDMEKFLKQMEEVKRQSAMEKEKADKQKKEQEAKDGMAKADELEKEGKYRDAWMKVPDMAEFPEKADEIRKRKSELSGKFAPDLFATVETTAPSQQQEEETAPLYPDYSDDEAEQELDWGENDNETEY